MGSLIEQYDSALIGILQNEGKIEPFVDAFLGFLYRRYGFLSIWMIRCLDIQYYFILEFWTDC